MWSNFHMWSPEVTIALTAAIWIGMAIFLMWQETPDAYRARAKECLKEAKATSNPQIKEKLQEIARQWLIAAERIERDKS